MTTFTYFLTPVTVYLLLRNEDNEDFNLTSFPEPTDFLTESFHGEFTMDEVS